MTTPMAPLTPTLARQELARAARGRPAAVTIGVFDGVHRGHQHLVRCLLERARQEDLAAIAVTFNPHPRAVLRPRSPISYLCSLEERVELLRHLGLDSVAILSFTSHLAQLAPADFLSLLSQELQMRLLTVGPDFALGRNREGNIDLLRSLGQSLGYRLEVAPLLTEDSHKVGSTAIRAALAQGQMEGVAKLLGRPFSLRGPVVPGDGRGRSLGFPTANIAVPLDRALPAFGVYATRAFLGETVHQSVTNIGIRPTFEEDQVTVETYILDFPAGEGDLYGQELRLDVLHRLRGEMRFPSVEALVEAIQQDIEATREYFRTW